MKQFAGKDAIVTGAASGIGRGIAEALLAEGARVIAADINDPGFGESSGQVRWVRHDVTSEESWERLFQSVVEEERVCSILVNAAGISVPGTVEDTSLEMFMQTMNINCTGIFLGCRALIAHCHNMPAAIVNIGSTVGDAPQPTLLAYGASKAAVHSMTRAIARHCADQGLNIRCNAVLPGATETPMFRRYIESSENPEATYRAYCATHPLGKTLERVASVEDITEAVLYLASKRAAFVTGVRLPVDGGFLA